MVSCHPVPRPVIHRDLQPESVSSSDCAKVMHCPFLKEFLRWKAVEPCKTRTGIVDLLDRYMDLYFLMLLLNYGTVSKFLCQTGRFSFKSFEIFSFFPGLGGRHFQRRGQLHNHRHPTFRYIPCDSATPETIPGLKAWVTCFGLQEGMWGWGLVKGSEFVL